MGIEGAEFVDVIKNAYVCSLRVRSQQKYWRQGWPAPETARFYFKERLIAWSIV